VYLVKFACLAMPVATVPAVLESGKLSDAQLAKIEEALSQADPTRNLRQVWIAERVYTLELSRQILSTQQTMEFASEGGQGLPESWNPVFSYTPSAFLRQMTARLLRQQDSLIVAASKDWPEILDAMRQAEGQPPSQWFDLWAELMYSGPAGMVTMLAGGCGSTVRSAQVAVMAERFRLARGRLPRSLEELGQFAGRELPTDPFTGKDLVYVVQGDGFMVYSVGEEKNDIGGPSQKAPNPRNNNVPEQKNWGVEVRIRHTPATATSQAN